MGVLPPVRAGGSARKALTVVNATCSIIAAKAIAKPLVGILTIVDARLVVFISLLPL